MPLGKSVEVIADQNRTAVVVPHLLREINFGRTLPVRLDLDEAAAVPIVRRNEDAVAARDRRRRVGNVVGCARVLPQKLPVFQVESEPTRVGEEDDLRGVSDLDRNRRGVTGAVALALPDQGAILLV